MANGDNNPDAVINEKLVDDSGDISIINNQLSKETDDNKSVDAGKQLSDNKDKDVNADKDKNIKKDEEALALELENLNKRYEGTGKEAKRLAALVKEQGERIKEQDETLSMFKDVLDEMIQKETKSNDVKLPEDFIFDADEALKKPDSDSGKAFKRYLQAEIDKGVSDKLKARDTQADQEKKKERFDREIDELRKDFGLSDDEVDDFIKDMKGTEINAKLFFKMLYPEKIKSKKDNNELEEKINQLLKAKKEPDDLDPKKIAEKEKNESQAVFERIAAAIDPFKSIQIQS